jgi:hypothetical protein
MADDRPIIEWTPAKLKRLIKAVEAAEGDTFVFEGHEYLKSYAKYLIEYLQMEFGEK